MIEVKVKGGPDSFCKKTLYKLKLSKETLSKIDLDIYGKRGVSALSSVTPVDTGKTANSWEYNITKEENKIKISFYNTNIVNGIPIAILIQYGHATKNGGFVEGINYINPAIKDVFVEMATSIWKEVTK